MGNTIFTKERRVCIKPLHSRLEAIQKMKAPFNLMRKGRQFVWGKEQQEVFEEIKRRLQKPPVLHMPDKVGRFQLYLDTSKYAT